ncbi:MAG: methyltransferase domain-containing protein, partial [Bacteroidales bacterium]|nr:methyltransferase domain-containing protein [Bacteroidales bacterium]
GGTWGMIDQGTLVAGVDRSGTPVKVAFDIETGERIGDLFASFTGLDMVAAGDVSFVVTENGIYAIDRVRYPVIQHEIDSILEEKDRLINSFIRRDYFAAFSDESGFEQQLDENTDKLNSLAEEVEKLKASASKWFFPQEHLSSIILAGDQVIAGGEGMVLGMNSETGEELWRDNIEGVAYGLSVSEQSLIVSTDKGPIYCYTGNSGKTETDRQEKVQGITTGSPCPEDKMTPVYEKAASYILKETGIEKGYCLVLDCGEGQLAYELAKKSNLNIIGIEKKPGKVQKARRRLDKAGLSGSRIVVENWSVNSLPDYFADLIVSGEILKQGRTNSSPAEIFRVLKPGGGVACFGQPVAENISHRPPDLEKLADEWTAIEIEEPELVRDDGHWILLTRKKLSGAGGWTHQYADPANTCCSDDKLVMAP